MARRDYRHWTRKKRNDRLIIGPIYYSNTPQTWFTNSVKWKWKHSFVMALLLRWHDYKLKVLIVLKTEMYKITDSYLSYCEFMQPTTCFPHYAFNLQPQTYLNTVLVLKMVCAYVTFLWLFASSWMQFSKCAISRIGYFNVNEELYGGQKSLFFPNHCTFLCTVGFVWAISGVSMTLSDGQGCPINHV